LILLDRVLSGTCPVPALLELGQEALGGELEERVLVLPILISAGSGASCDATCA
jgi:hypothetical protein